jgi:hypothetical protein
MCTVNSKALNLFKKERCKGDLACIWFRQAFVSPLSRTRRRIACNNKPTEKYFSVAEPEPHHFPCWSRFKLYNIYHTVYAIGKGSAPKQQTRLILYNYSFLILYFSKTKKRGQMPI